jgi:hypothetical protein
LLFSGNENALGLIAAGEVDGGAVLFVMLSNDMMNQKRTFLFRSRISSMYGFVLIYHAFACEMAFEALSIR